jgi:hypothetical protein
MSDFIKIAIKLMPSMLIWQVFATFIGHMAQQ